MTDFFNRGRSAAETARNDQDAKLREVGQRLTVANQKAEKLYNNISPRFSKKFGCRFSSGKISISYLGYGDDGPVFYAYPSRVYIGQQSYFLGPNYDVQCRIRGANGLEEPVQENNCSEDRVLELAGLFYGSWS